MTDVLRRIEEKQPKHVGDDLRWCGHLGANQYGCVRCAITQQNDELDRLHQCVVKLTRALHAIANYEEQPEVCYDEFAYHRMAESFKDCAKRVLEEVAGE